MTGTAESPGVHGTRAPMARVGPYGQSTARTPVPLANQTAVTGEMYVRCAMWGNRRPTKRCMASDGLTSSSASMEKKTVT